MALVFDSNRMDQPDRTAPVFAPQRLPLLAMTAWMAALIMAAAAHGWRLAALAGVGVLLGASLWHASFGFSSGYRRLLVHGDGRGVLAQLLLLALLILVFAPILLSGTPQGAVAPLALQAVIGATLFGVGMQLGRGRRGRTRAETPVTLPQHRLAGRPVELQKVAQPAAQVRIAGGTAQ